MIPTSYEEIIDWIIRDLGPERFTYDLYNPNEVDDFRREIARRYDDPRIKHFIEGNPHMTRYMIDKGRARWTGLEGTDAERVWHERLERPIIDVLNERAEKSLLEQIESADSMDELGEVDIPTNLLEEVKEKLERSKTERFGELKGAEFRREIESPETELSRLLQIEQQLHRIPDESIRRELKEASKKERERLADLSKFFLNELKRTTNEAELDNVINNIRDSDLRGRQKERLIEGAEGRRREGFPELI